MGADEEGTLAALQAHRRTIVDPAIANHRGRIVKTTGDGLLVEFASAVDAVRCAVDLQRGMAERNAATPPERRIEFRIGINVGDIIGDGADIYGDGVNVAARLEAMAEPGGICVSRAVRDPVRDKLAFTFEDLGERSAKNIARPIHVFRVRHEAEGARPQVLPRRALRRLVLALAALLVIAGAGAGAWVWWQRAQADAPPPLSLVVLPFETIGADQADTYLAEGITDDLTTALSHIPGTFVISRATAFAYRGKAEDIRRIGRDLNVRYAVRGSVQRMGQMLRVNAELGSTATGAQLWSDDFDQPMSDLAAGQEAIVIRMRSALDISLADIEAARSLRERSANPDAFDLILRARAIVQLPRTKDTASQTLSLYEQALDHDPNAVLALTGAADATLTLLFLEALPYAAALDRATQYLERAQALEPNAESVLMTQAAVLDWREDGLDYRRVRTELKAVAQKLIDLYPNNPNGYDELGVLARNEGRFDEAAALFAKTIRLSPRDPQIRNLYWDMAYCSIWAGRDREGLEWADRSNAAPGGLPALRVRFLLFGRIAAYYRTGEVDAAKRLAAEAAQRYPLATWRGTAPADPDSETNVAQARSFQDALRGAGVHGVDDPDADFGVPSDAVLHAGYEGKTPMAAPGVTTVTTAQLAAMLEHERPLVIDAMNATWYRSVPGAVGLDAPDNGYGSFTDAVQQRLERKLHELTGGDMAKPIVVLGFGAVRFDGYNLTLRVRHAGYTNVYWYRGGRVAWEVAAKPEDVVRPADW